MQYSHRLTLAAVLACAPSISTPIAIAQPVASAGPTIQRAAPNVGAPATAQIPEGTEIHMHLTEAVSSATASAGDTFSAVTDEEIILPDGTILPAGYSGKGEVTAAEKAGMIGKSGQLNIRMDYLKVGASRIHLRANKGGEGKSGVTNMVVAAVLLGPLGLLVRGHSIVYPKGQRLTAFVDEDIQIPLPVAPPPRLD